jgi:predicted short-subunit dehydrogenase-like oxidoreductase (DUF2520 family)
MYKQPFVSFIGSGNLAWHLAPALDNAGFSVREVYSRESKNAKALVGKLYEGEIKKDLDFSTSKSRIFVIAVSDDAIESIAQEIVLPENAVLVHTSGSQPLSLLENAVTESIGVFYPLQTFSKNKKVDFKDIPLFIESNIKEVEKLLMEMAKAISKKVVKIDSRQRKALHVAAVFASNFTNHMLRISNDILKTHKLDVELLKPLIAETITKALAIGPEDAQTGPARRGDLELLDNHYAFLEEDDEVAEIYKLVSQHILDQYH